MTQPCSECDCGGKLEAGLVGTISVIKGDKYLVEWDSGAVSACSDKDDILGPELAS